MTKYYFLNNSLVGISSDGIAPNDYDTVRENLTDKQLDFIGQGYVFSQNEEGEEELVQPENWQTEQDEKQAQAKKEEALSIILSRYPLRKQINLNRAGGLETDEMNARIDAIRLEENTNGKDADYSSFL